MIWYFVEAHSGEFHIPMSFMKSAQAIEAYSRRMKNNKLKPDEEFKEWVESITGNIKDDDDRELVTGIISNEPRLRDRLVEIFNDTNFILGLSNKRKKSLINMIVNTRNYYTHFDSKLESQAMKQETIFYVTLLLKSVMRILLLLELGLENEFIKGVFKNDQDFLFVMERLGYIELNPPATIEVK